MTEFSLGLAQSLDFLPYDYSPEAREQLPGVQALKDQPFLLPGPDFAGHMALRLALVQNHKSEVLYESALIEDTCNELLDHVTENLGDDYDVRKEIIVRPDGFVVPRELSPLYQLALLVQEDFCVLEKRGDEHVLVAALLCFPAGWLLAAKINRPLIKIHDTVEPYTEDIAIRVQRLFDGVKVGQALWRANSLKYHDPSLFQPYKTETPQSAPRFLRTERQLIFRLPVSKAVVFSIRTTVAQMPVV